MLYYTHVHKNAPLAAELPVGLCPQHQTSAGKIKKRRVRKGANPAARALRLAAQGCHHAKNALGAFYRRIQARCGGAKAVVATGARSPNGSIVC